MKVGDLVRYKYRKQDIGIIVETGQGVSGRASKHKVMWIGFHNCCDWMHPVGLELLNASR